MRHELKIWPEYFAVAWAGHKPFEIRKNDRKFKVWDEIVLQEFDPTREGAEYTGREIEGFITYITDFQQKDDYIVFAYDEKYRQE